MTFPAIQGLKKTGYKPISMPTLSNEQMDLFNQLMGGAQAGLGGQGKGLDFLSRLAGGDPSQFEQLEAPAQRQFQGAMGNIASRFSNEGGLGARKSSGFGHATTSAAQGLAEQLQSQRMGLQQDAISQLLGLSNQLLGTPLRETMLAPKKKPWWQELLGGMSGGVGQGIGGLAGLFLGKKLGMQLKG